MCVKYTPDSAANMSVEGGKANWGDSPMVINPWDEYALEEALRIKDKYGGNVTVLTMGDETAKDALRTSIAMGCDHGVLILGESSSMYDTRFTSQVISKAIPRINDFHLVFFGKQAIDGDTGLVPMSVANLLDWPGLSYVSKIVSIDENNDGIEVVRLLDEGYQDCIAKLPCVISVVKEINEPRYPSFVGIRKASKVEIEVIAVDELVDVEVEPSLLRWSVSKDSVDTYDDPEILQGDDMSSIARALITKLTADKVI